MKNRKLWVSVVAGILAALMLLGLFAGLVPASAASSGEIRNQIDEKEDELDDIKKQIAELESQMSDNLSEMESIVAQKNLIDQEIFLLHEQVLNINEQISAYSLLIADKQEELDAAEARLQALNEKNKERIRAMEEDGKLSYWSVLFKANDFSDLLDRLDMIQEIAAADRRRLREMSEAAEKVASAQAELETEKANLEETRAELDEAEASLQGKREEADALLIQLKAKGDEYEAMIEEGEDAQAALQDEIAKLEDDFDKKKREEYLQWLSTSVPPTTKPKPTTPTGDPGGVGGDVGGSANGITWLKPTNYSQVSSPYGWRIHPVYGTRKFHGGVDLSASQGTEIYASRSGVVTVAKYSSSGGYYVTINHGDGFSTSYLHMTHYIVGVGDHVSAGQVIGYVGNTGLSKGAHLHFSVYYNGNTVNPADYINF